MTEATNVVIRNNDLLEPRPGFQTRATAGATAGITYQDKQIFHDGTTSMVQGLAATYTAISGSYTPPSTTTRMKFAEQQKNLYFTTNNGAYAMTSPTATPTKAGVPAIQNIVVTQSTNLSGVPNAATTWFASNGWIAYRVTLCIKDANSYLHESEPCGRLQILNPANAGTAIGGMVRATNVVTVTTLAAHNFRPSDQFYYDAVDAGTGGAFGAGPFTITGVASSTTFTYAEVAANSTNVAAHTIYSGTKTVTIRFMLPSESSTSHFYRVYRTPATVDAAVLPSDDMYQVYEKFLTGTDVSNHYVDFTDTTPESSLYSTPLYTSPNIGDGISQANVRPPLAEDIASWQESLWFANTTQRHRKTIQLLGVPANNDTITVDGVVYTFKTTLGVGTGDVQLVSSMARVSDNIALTAQALVYTINSNNVIQGTTTVSAYYISDPNGAPGKILLERDNLSGASFNTSASVTTMWNPVLTSSPAITSDNNAQPNALYYSKLDQPEAVPLLNFITVGAKNKPILRIVPLRDKLFVFKEDAIYVVSGAYPSFRVDILDNATWLVARDSVAIVNNAIFALTNQGFVMITESGIQIISKPIDDIAQDCLRGYYANNAGLAYTVGISSAGFESINCYAVYLNTVTTTDYYLYLFNYLNKSWVRWTLPIGSSYVRGIHADRKAQVLYYGTADGNLWETRQVSTSLADDPSRYADKAAAITISAVVGNVLTVSVGSSSVTVGDVILRGGNYSVVTDKNGSAVTVVDATGMTAGAGTCYQGYTCTAEWTPFFGGEPSGMKHFAESELHFRRANFYKGTVTTRGELSTSTVTSTLRSHNYVVNTNPGEEENFRFLIPIEKQRGTLVRLGFSIRESFARWALQGYSVTTHQSQQPKAVKG